MKALYALIIIALVPLTGCISSMNNLSVGMSKAQVISAMGRPHSTAAVDDVELLRYGLIGTPAPNSSGGEYFVKLTNGEVSSYGRMGDFDSTKDPTLNLNIKNR